MVDQRVRYNQSEGKEGAFLVAVNYCGGLPFGKAENYPIWCGMYDQMGAAGILNCGATVNKYVDVDVEGDMPSTCQSEFLVMVTCTDKENKRVYDAGYGLKHIDLGSPGEWVYSTHSSAIDAYSLFRGTSAATPIVAGAVGLLYSYPCKAWSDLQKSNPAEAVRIAKRALLAGVDKNNDLTGLTVSGGRFNIRTSLDSLNKLICNLTFDDDFRILSLYPNPAQTNLQVQLNTKQSGIYFVEIIDAMGRKLFSQENQFIASQFDLSLPSLTDGIYILRLTRDLNHASKKFIIRN